MLIPDRHDISLSALSHARSADLAYEKIAESSGSNIDSNRLRRPSVSMSNGNHRASVYSWGT